MGLSHLSLVRNIAVSDQQISFAEKLADHECILEGYFNTFVTRNLSDTTIYHLQTFLKKWFRNFAVPDITHPDGERQLLVWEAMEPARGRQLIVGYSKGLCELGLAARTVIANVGDLRRFFDYLCRYPYIPDPTPISIASKYGSIEQPVLELDYPTHSLDHEHAGPALTGKRLAKFYDFIRLDYIKHAKKKYVARRNYSLVVLAGECGGRANELVHLNATGSRRDLFYEDGFIQIRWGKAANGSGKRNRKTVFSLLAQDTMRVYEEQVRQVFLKGNNQDALFLTEQGKRITYGAMYAGLTAIVKKAREAGIELPDELCWHDLRRAFATNFLERNPDQIGLLLMMMGHSSLGTIYRYVRHSQAYYEKAMSCVIRKMKVASTGA